MILGIFFFIRINKIVPCTSFFFYLKIVTFLHHLIGIYVSYISYFVIKNFKSIIFIIFQPKKKVIAENKNFAIKN